MKKGLKIALISLGSLVGLLLIVTLLAGPIVKWYAEKHSVELCHREATIGQVWINVFTGSVLIKDLQVQEEDPKDDFLKFDKLYVRLSLPKMLGQKVLIQRVKLQGLDTKIIQKGIRFNFSDIIELYTNKPKKEKKKESKPWDVDIRKISVKDSKVVYVDANMGSSFDTRNINIDVPRLYLKGDATNADISMDFSDKGKMVLKAAYDIQKGDFDGDLQLSQFQIKDIQPYLENFMNIGRMSGVANGHLKAKGCVKHITDLVASGSLSVKNAKIFNADNTPLGTFSNFTVDIAKVELGKKNFKINKVFLKDLVFHFDRYQGETTLTRLFKKKEETESTTNTASESVSETSKSQEMPIKYLLKNLLVENGSVVYTDYAVAPQKQTFTVSGLKISSENMQNGHQSPITVVANLGNSGRLECQGHADVLDLHNADMDLSIENLDITEFTPYSLYYFAYPVTDGLLSFNTSLTIANNWLDSKNSLDIYKPAFGKKDKSLTPKAAKIPMKAAMYVITDRKGHVKMDLPVKGDVSSPDFSFKKVIWKTFVNLLVKVAASPIDFIANLGGNNVFKDMQFPADAPVKLSMEDTYQLNEIAAAMKEKEQTNLSIAVGCNMNSDGQEPNDAVELQKRQQCYSTISNYLSGQGIPSSRISFDETKRPVVSADNLKVVFNLSVEE